MLHSTPLQQNWLDYTVSYGTITKQDATVHRTEVVGNDVRVACLLEVPTAEEREEENGRGDGER